MKKLYLHRSAAFVVSSSSLDAATSEEIRRTIAKKRPRKMLNLKPIFLKLYKKCLAFSFLMIIYVDCITSLFIEKS